MSVTVNGMCGVLNSAIAEPRINAGVIAQRIAAVPAEIDEVSFTVAVQVGESNRDGFQYRQVNGRCPLKSA